MTTFAELRDLTVAQTRRPEVQAITDAAIRTAVLRAHHVDFFPRDLLVGSLSYTPISGGLYQDFPTVTTLLPRLRALKTLYGIDPVSYAQIEQLEFRETDDVYDKDGYQRPSVYNLIGDTLRCYIQVWSGALQAHYYANPVVTEAGFSSWIADQYQDDVAQWAAGIVQGRLGYLEQAQLVQRTYVEPFKEQLVASHLLGNVN